MADVRPVEEEALPARCPWCSAALASPDAPKCPSCGATLTADTEPQLPGVTTVAPQSIARSTDRRRPNRIVQWITGEAAEAPAAPAPATPGSLTPPSADVRVEMMRLELAARLAQRSAEVDALESEARLDAGTPSGAGSGTNADLPVNEEPADEARPRTWAELDEREAGSGQATNGQATNGQATNGQAAVGTSDAPSSGIAPTNGDSDGSTDENEAPR